MPKLDLVQFVWIEFIQAPILHALQVLVASEGQLEITLETDQSRVQLGRMGRLAALDYATVVESQVQHPLDVVQGCLGIFPITEHSRAIFDLLCLLGMPVPLDPKLHETLDFLMVSLAQGVKGGIIIVFPCAGDQFLEGFLAIVGEAEFLHEPNLAGSEGSPGKDESDGDGGDGVNLHGFKSPFHGKGFRRSLRGRFGFTNGGPVSIVQDEDREIPGVI